MAPYCSIPMKGSRYMLDVVRNRCCLSSIALVRLPIIKSLISKGYPMGFCYIRTLFNVYP